MVFGVFLEFGRYSICSISRTRTFGIFVSVSTLSLINIYILSWMDHTSRDQHMTEIILVFVTNPTKTSMKDSNLSSLC